MSFRTAAKIANIKPSEICYNLMCVKMARIAADMANGKVPTDSTLDLLNYDIDLVVLLEEEKLG